MHPCIREKEKWSKRRTSLLLITRQGTTQEHASTCTTTSNDNIIEEALQRIPFIKVGRQAPNIFTSGMKNHALVSGRSHTCH